MLDGQTYQVIGVVQPGAFDRDRTQFWEPFTQEELSRAIHQLTVYGRLRARQTLVQARQRRQI